MSAGSHPMGMKLSDRRCSCCALGKMPYRYNKAQQCSFLRMIEVNPPPRKPTPNPWLGKGCPGSLGCVRRSQRPTCVRSCKGTKCLGVGGEAGCCGGAGTAAGGGGLLQPCQVWAPDPIPLVWAHPSSHSPSSKMVVVSSVPLFGSRRIF